MNDGHPGIWVAAALLSVAGLVLFLQWQFPGALQSDYAHMRMVYLRSPFEKM